MRRSSKLNISEFISLLFPQARSKCHKRRADNICIPDGSTGSFPRRTGCAGWNVFIPTSTCKIFTIAILRESFPLRLRWELDIYLTFYFHVGILNILTLMPYSCSQILEKDWTKAKQNTKSLLTEMELRPGVLAFRSHMGLAVLDSWPLLLPTASRWC